MAGSKTKVVGLENVIENLKKVGISTIKKAVEESEITAAQMENSSKTTRPWTDRTGDARRSIYGYADITPKTIVIYHGIRVDYGKYLELSHGGKYRVIAPTVNSFRSIWLNNLSTILSK